LPASSVIYDQLSVKLIHQC